MEQLNTVEMRTAEVPATTRSDDVSVFTSSTTVLTSTESTAEITSTLSTSPALKNVKSTLPQTATTASTEPFSTVELTTPTTGVSTSVPISTTSITTVLTSVETVEDASTLSPSTELIQTTLPKSAMETVDNTNAQTTSATTKPLETTMPKKTTSASTEQLTTLTLSTAKSMVPKTIESAATSTVAIMPTETSAENATTTRSIATTGITFPTTMVTFKETIAENTSTPSISPTTKSLETPLPETTGRASTEQLNTVENHIATAMVPTSTGSVATTGITLPTTILTSTESTSTLSASSAPRNIQTTLPHTTTSASTEPLTAIELSTETTVAPTGMSIFTTAKTSLTTDLTSNKTTIEDTTTLATSPTIKSIETLLPAKTTSPTSTGITLPTTVLTSIKTIAENTSTLSTSPIPKTLYNTLPQTTTPATTVVPTTMPISNTAKTSLTTSIETLLPETKASASTERLPTLEMSTTIRVNPTTGSIATTGITPPTAALISKETSAPSTLPKFSETPLPASTGSATVEATSTLSTSPITKSTKTTLPQTITSPTPEQLTIVELSTATTMVPRTTTKYIATVGKTSLKTYLTSREITAENTSTLSTSLNTKSLETAPPKTTASASTKQLNAVEKGATTSVIPTTSESISTIDITSQRAALTSTQVRTLSESPSTKSPETTVTAVSASTSQQTTMTMQKTPDIQATKSVQTTSEIKPVASTSKESPATIETTIPQTIKQLEATTSNTKSLTTSSIPLKTQAIEITLIDKTAIRSKETTTAETLTPPTLKTTRNVTPLTMPLTSNKTLTTKQTTILSASLSPTPQLIETTKSIPFSTNTASTQSVTSTKAVTASTVQISPISFETTDIKSFVTKLSIEPTTSTATSTAKTSYPQTTTSLKSLTTTKLLTKPTVEPTAETSLPKNTMYSETTTIVTTGSGSTKPLTAAQNTTVLTLLSPTTKLSATTSEKGYFTTASTSTESPASAETIRISISPRTNVVKAPTANITSPSATTKSHTTATTLLSSVEEVIVPASKAPVYQPNGDITTTMQTTISQASRTLSASISTGSPAVVDFTFNLTLVNVTYNPQFQDQSSEIYRVMSAILLSRIDNVFQKTIIGPAYTGCRDLIFRPGMVPESFSIDCVCSYLNNTVGQKFTKQSIYKEVQIITNGIKNLDKYPLDSSSLYIDGYNEYTVSTTIMPTSHSSTTAHPEDSSLTVNFTLTNLKYVQEFAKPSSSNYNNTRVIMTTLLDALMKNTSLKMSFSSCQLISLENSQGDTKINAMCNYSSSLVTTPFNTVAFYKELKNQTFNVTRLEIYALNPNSLYVNGYNEQTSVSLISTTIPTTPSTAVYTFTVNVTVTNLLYTSDMGSPNTTLFNNTQLTWNTLLDSLMNKTSIKDTSCRCKVVAFGLANSQGTKVDAVCTYTHHTPFDTPAFYKELKNLTSNFSNLNIYNLDPNSVYVNGYNEKLQTPTATSPTTSTAARTFTVNFTLTNLLYTSDMGIPNTATFNNTKHAMDTLLDMLINKTSENKTTVCTAVKLSIANSRDTKVDAVCTTNQTAPVPFNTMSYYRELKNLTSNFSTFGIYTLDSNSFYVNGYNEKATTPTSTAEPPIEAGTKIPVQAASSEEITLNFTISNLAFTSDLESKQSLKYNSTSKAVLYLVNNLMKNSTLSSKLINCLIDGFVRVNAVGTKVNIVCKIKKDTTGLEFDKVAFYNEFANMTLNITKLHIYELDRNSLYVNGYNNAMATITTKSPPLTTFRVFGPRQFFINFTITNLNFNASLANKTSDPFKNIKNKLENLLNTGFKNSSRIKDNFEICEVTRLRTTPKSEDTTVEAICTFNVDLLARSFTEDDVANSLLEITNNGTILGNFTLSKSSIHVNIFRVDETTTVSGSITTTATVIVLPSPALRGFNVNFTILNNSVPDDPEKRKMLEDDILNKINLLYRNSALGKKFDRCLLSSIRNGSIVVSCKCYFEDDPAVNMQSVQNEFNQGTYSGKVLGSVYTLRDISVTEIPRDDDLPFWAIILICLAVLFGLVLLFLIIFMLIFCLNKRKGSVDLQPSIYGTYFPHLDMRKLY